MVIYVCWQRFPFQLFPFETLNLLLDKMMWEEPKLGWLVHITARIEQEMAMESADAYKATQQRSDEIRFGSYVEESAEPDVPLVS